MGLPRILFYVVGRAVTALLAGFGLGFDITGTSVLNRSPDDWGLIGLFAFAVFLVVTIVREVDLAFQARPKIDVEPRIEDHQAVLIVTNKGITKANFSAKARLKSFTSPPRLQNTEMFLRLPWESYNEVDYPIKGGGDWAKLLVAGMSAHTIIIDGDLGGLHDILKKAGAKIKKTNTYDGELLLKAFINKEIRTTPLYQWQVDYTAGAEPPSYTCEIEISIFADPALRKPFKRIYQLQLKGHGLSFMEKSTSRKEDYQT